MRPFDSALRSPILVQNFLHTITITVTTRARGTAVYDAHSSPSQVLEGWGAVLPDYAEQSCDGAMRKRVGLTS